MEHTIVHSDQDVSFHRNLRIRESRILLYGVSSAFEASGIGAVIGIALLHVLVGLLLLPLFLLLIGLPYSG